MGVEVREADRGDADVVAQIHVASFRATYENQFSAQELSALSVPDRARVWERRLGVPGRVLLAASEDAVRGFAWIGPSDDEDEEPGRVWQLRSIHVAPTAQGLGIGRSLLEAARAAMRSAGACEATLWVVEDNERAHRTYRRDGWESDGARREERLALPGEAGPVVTVQRMRRSLSEVETG